MAVVTRRQGGFRRLRVFVRAARYPKRHGLHRPFTLGVSPGGPDQGSRTDQAGEKVVPAVMADLILPLIDPTAGVQNQQLAQDMAGSMKGRIAKVGHQVIYHKIQSGNHLRRDKRDTYLVAFVVKDV